jgi:hypothetical protein
MGKAAKAVANRGSRIDKRSCLHSCLDCCPGFAGTGAPTMGAREVRPVLFDARRGCSKDSARLRELSHVFISRHEDPSYNRYFDFLGLNGKISNADFTQFSNRFGKSFIY